MRVIVTGAGGFLGQALVPLLASAHDVVPVDSRLGGLPGIEGDICDPATLEGAFASGCDAVVHLATIPGGAAEQDPASAKRVNIDATMALVDQAAAAGTTPRFIFASSIAVFGDPMPPFVDDDTPLAPHMLYGAHKAMMELWIDTSTRRGAISGLSLRLPGIVARPHAPSGMKSAFISDLFHALATRQPIILPVSADATLWLMSVAQAARAIAHCLAIEATGALTLPALRTRMGALVAAIARATGADPGLAVHAPDPALEAAFGRLPPLATPRADALGFRADADLDTLVASALATLTWKEAA